MNDELIKRHNEIVKAYDIVYHLGDFALTNKENISKLLSELNGEFILILGNHDKSKSAMLDCGFIKVYEDKHILQHTSNNSGIIMTHRQLMNEMQTINVSVDNWGFYPIPLPKTRFWIQLCGHSHGNWLTGC